MKHNKTGAIPVQIIRNPDYLDPISFRALGLPAGIVPEFDPSGSLPGASLLMLLLRINPETRVGRYNFSVLGTGDDNRTACCNLSLKIEEDRYFTISAIPPMIEVGKGNDSQFSMEFLGVNNYTGKIKLRIIKYLESIIKMDIKKTVVELAPSSRKDRSNITLHASDSASLAGSYNVIVNALGQDGYSANCSIMVIIEGQEGYFKISPQFSSMQLKPEESKKCEITIEGFEGYEGAITMRVSDLPGIAANIDPNAIITDGQNSIPNCLLSVNAQAEAGSEAKSDIIISGSDARQNSDECRIATSFENEPPAAQQLPAKLQVAEPQISAIPENVEPPVEQPSATEPPATKPDVAEKPEINAATSQEVQADPSPDNTTSKEFFDEISGKNINYNNIPIESISSGARNRWYKNEPGSANYVGEYEIRKELFFSKNEYTIKVVLNDLSRPIDVIFIQDENIVSEVPSGFVEQAMRKLSNL
jgi:hypothetical protein